MQYSQAMWNHQTNLTWNYFAYMLMIYIYAPMYHMADSTMML